MKKELYKIFGINHQIYVMLILILITLMAFTNYLNTLGFILLLIILALLILHIKDLITFYHILKIVNKNEFNKIQKVLVSKCGLYRVNKGKLIFTNKYIIKKFWNISLLKYLDIVLTYQDKNNLVIITKDNKLHNYYLENPNEETIKRIFKLIKKYNPYAYININKENVKKIKERYGIILDIELLED